MTTAGPVPVGKVSFRLSLCVAVLAAIAAATGLLWPAAGGSPLELVSVRGEPVTLFGHGLYRHDSLFFGAGFLAQNFVTLVLAVPLLIVSALQSRHGSITWSAIRLAPVAFILYVYATMALGAFYNELFLVYVASFSASLFTLILASRSIRSMLEPTWSQGARSAPRRGPAILLVVSGMFTLFV